MLNSKKKTMRKLIISSVLFSVTLFATAQQAPLNSHYFINKMLLNPAFTGNGENVNAFLTHRSQWTGVQGAPQTSYLTIDGPIGEKNIGLGLNVFTDNTDISSRTGANGNYSYKLDINPDNSLRFGLGVGMYDYKLDFSKAIYRDKSDPNLLQTTVHKTVFNADFGIAYNWKALEVGFAVPQLLGNKVNYNENNSGISYKVARQYVTSAKYVFDVIKDKDITAYPLVVVRASKATPLQYDVNAILDWKKMGWFGVSYRSASAIGLNIGIRYKSLMIGYAYDLGLGKIKAYSGNTSEFLLGFTFGGKKVEEVPVQTGPTAAELDAASKASDEELAKLKAKNADNEAEIKKIKEELAAIKANPPVAENIKVGDHSNLEKENGASLDAGYFIVIGTFSSMDNAIMQKAYHITKGYSTAQVIQNKKTGLYQVYVEKVATKEAAMTELAKFKKDYPDAWINKVE